MEVRAAVRLCLALQIFFLGHTTGLSRSNLLGQTPLMGALIDVHRQKLLQHFDQQLILAPLTRGGNLPFRRLCAVLSLFCTLLLILTACKLPLLCSWLTDDALQDFGCRIAFSEMANAHKLMLNGYEGRRERARLYRAPNEGCFGLQIGTNSISEGIFAGKLAAEIGLDFLGMPVDALCSPLPFAGDCP